MTYSQKKHIDELERKQLAENMLKVMSRHDFMKYLGDAVKDAEKGTNFGYALDVYNQTKRIHAYIDYNLSPETRETAQGMLETICAEFSK